MKLNVISILFLFIASSSFSQGYSVTEEINDNRHLLTFTMDEWCVCPTRIGGKQFEKIDFGTSTSTETKGWAAMPFISSNIKIGDKKRVMYKVVDSEKHTITLRAPLVPSRGAIYRNQNPDSISYEISPESLKSDKYPKEFVEVDEPYYIRDFHGVSIRFYPFCYNAIEQKLLIYTRITVEVVEVEENTRN